jgi:hypothetical protein
LIKRTRKITKKEGKEIVINTLREAAYNARADELVEAEKVKEVVRMGYVHDYALAS